MRRRSFIASTATIVAMAPLPACWIRGGTFREIENYVRVALVAFDRVLAILVEHGVSTDKYAHAIAVVKAALADIITAVEEFREHRHDTQLAAIKVALEIAADRLNEFWVGLGQVPDTLLHTVKLLLDVIIQTLDGYARRLGSQKTFPNAQPRTISEFRHDFNLILGEKGESKFAV